MGLDMYLFKVLPYDGDQENSISSKNIEGIDSNYRHLAIKTKIKNSTIKVNCLKKDYTFSRRPWIRSVNEEQYVLTDGIKTEAIDKYLFEHRYLVSNNISVWAVSKKELGYWRKANQIHNWFVENIQNGIDDQAEYPVSIENLEELRSLCKKILNDKNLAEDLLPTQSGFFFGSTEYDEWYFQNIKDTIQIIDEALIDLQEEEVLVYTCWW